MSVRPAEPSLRPDPVVERFDLGSGAWVDVARGFVEAPGALYETVVEDSDGSQGRVFRYERWVAEPRLGAWRALDRPGCHPVLVDATRWLTHRYRVRFDGYA